MHIALADYLVHASNILLLVSYSVRNILWLRWFAVAAAIINIPYFLLQSDVLWPPVAWAIVFTLINLYQIGRIYWERRPVVLSAEEQKLYDMGFQDLALREFVSLLMVGEWRNAFAGDRILTVGKPADAICIAVSGTIRVSRQDREVGKLEPGRAIGTAVALLGEPSPVDAAFADAGRYIRWPLPHIRSFMERKPELRAVLERLASRELAQKLKTAVAV
jgi:hypothetical protein